MHLSIFWLALASWTQNDPKALEGVDSKRVEAAIADGLAAVQRLKDQKGDPKTDELALLTFVHAGLAQDDPSFQAVLKRMLENPLEHTYNVALQAVVLEKIDLLKHHGRILQCAQFLADNQCRNGQWSYGQPIAPVKMPVASNGAKSSGSTKALKKVPVFPRPPMGGSQGENHRDSGDNSNSQYAALGLRACHDAGILFPRDLIVRARQSWIDGQEKAAAGKAVATGASPRGWGYNIGKGAATGSMTVGGVGAVVIYDHILGIDFKRDPVVLSGTAWLAKNFTVARNPERADNLWHYYYLYGMERAGTLFAAEKFGSNSWYREGVAHLLEAQSKGGTWCGQDDGGNDWGKSIRDTCFAVLFLRRATKPLIDVASVDPFRGK